MTPQIYQSILTGYLILLLITGIYTIIKNKFGRYNDKHKIFGAIIGIIMRTVILFILLWNGQFYK